MLFTGKQVYDMFAVVNEGLIRRNPEMIVPLSAETLDYYTQEMVNLGFTTAEICSFCSYVSRAEKKDCAYHQEEDHGN